MVFATLVGGGAAITAAVGAPYFGTLGLKILPHIFIHPFFLLGHRLPMPFILKKFQKPT
jgi:hypothetical protein